METFLELKEKDFVRLKLRTKIIITIEKLQKQFLNDSLIVEELEEDFASTSALTSTATTGDSNSNGDSNYT